MSRTPLGLLFLAFALQHCAGSTRNTASTQATVENPIVAHDATTSSDATDTVAIATTSPTDSNVEADAAIDESESTQAGSTEPPADPTDEQLQAQTRTGQTPVDAQPEESSINAWILTRILQARAGTEERVRLLLTFRSSAWGCSCPSYFIGGDPDAHTGGSINWLEVRWARGVSEPRITTDENGVSQGYQIWVEGQFTGDRTEMDLRNENGEPSDYFYRPWEFRVLSRVRRAPSGDLVGTVHRTTATTPRTPAPSPSPSPSQRRR